MNDPDAEVEVATTKGTAISPPPSSDQLACCCGRTDCVYLKHNCSILDSVEKDVHRAAKMGQNLLARHEAYMADAERDRIELTGRIEQLEMDKKALEADNASKIEEHRGLLDQLELLNNAAADSEVTITSLEAALQSSEQTVRRLETAATRAEDMERHLALLEMEQERLQNSLCGSQTETRSALSRWKQAERGIQNLQEQLEMMEAEAQEERGRHAEMMERLERQRAMEKDLNTAAGRLKGASAAKVFHDGKGASVVTHFVRDLLQDNANLQIGITELREMLMNSNDEIQNLRDQIAYHQPADVEDVSATSTLRSELEPAGLSSPPPHHSPSVSQELHIHHHYHVAKAEAKKGGKKKRAIMSSGVFTPPTNRWQGDQHPTLLRHRAKDSASTVSGPSHRWSVFSDQPSDFPASSVPSSPVSNSRFSSMFDRSIAEMSLPTSPTSIDPTSPLWQPMHRKTCSGTSDADIGSPGLLATSAPSHSVDTPTPRSVPEIAIVEEDTSASASASTSTPAIIPVIPESSSTTSLCTEVGPAPPDSDEVAADEPESSDLTSTTTETDDVTTPRTLSPNIATSQQPFPYIPDEEEDDDDDHFSNVWSSPFDIKPRLRRAASHESVQTLASCGDIALLRGRPSQLSLRPIGATANISTVTARPTMSKGSGSGKRGSMVLRDSLAMGLPSPRARVASAATPSRSATGSLAAHSQRSASGMLSKLGSWRPWGSSSSSNSNSNSNSNYISSPSTPVAVASAAAAIAAAASPSVKSSPVVSSEQTTPKAIQRPLLTREKELSRAPGINQPGSIPGFHEYLAAHQRRAPPSKVLPDHVDQDALREGLGG